MPSGAGTREARTRRLVEQRQVDVGQAQVRGDRCARIETEEADAGRHLARQLEGALPALKARTLRLVLSWFSFRGKVTVQRVFRP
jgi:hypothetical protein